MEKECSLDPVARTELILRRAAISVKLDKGLKRPWRRHRRSEASTGLFIGRHTGSRGTPSGALASTLGPNLQGREFAGSWAALGGREGERDCVCGPGEGGPTGLRTLEASGKFSGHWGLKTTGVETRKLKYSWPLKNEFELQGSTCMQMLFNSKYDSASWSVVGWIQG